ncbi:MAG: hypothetical protein JSS96_01460 [Bacteroidetes bacterium]|nr:hypothetical protein [Bacteroidota bacterium]
MKPNDFDNLIRSKFDENDFEYSPGNWDKLAARMDGDSGKRRTFLWVPMAIIASTASIAASLAMIISIPVLMHHKSNAPLASVAHQSAAVRAKNNIADLQPIIVPVTADVNTDFSKNIAKAIINNTNNKKDNSLSLRAVFNANEKAAKAANSLLAFNAAVTDAHSIEITENPKYPVYNTFSTERDPKSASKAKTTISIAGGLNYGNATSGYSIGATGKRMLGDRFYIESDLAFVNDNTTEKSEYWVANSSESRAIASRIISNDFSAPSSQGDLPSVTMPLSNASSNENPSGNIGSSLKPVKAAAKMTLPVTATVSPYASANAAVTSLSGRPAGRLSSSLSNNNATVRRYAGAKMVSSGGSSERPVEASPTPAAATAQQREVNYNLYYAQVTPTLGYNIHKKISVGVGADVQRLLLNETSVSASSDGGQQTVSREVPSFDLGFVGKAECALSNTIKAGVSYRQGLNNVVAPNANYLDRNYVQVQLKFLLLRK